MDEINKTYKWQKLHVLRRTFLSHSQKHWKTYLALIVAIIIIGTPLAVSAIKNILVADNKTIDIQIGSQPIRQVYIGNKLVWENNSMQEVTTMSCPTTKDVAYDARDGQRYFIQKLADGQCWMLSNLRYAGGGNNTYGDIKTITNITAGTTSTNTTPTYFDSGGTANYSNTAPIDGYYGYLYNWCAAMGNQSSACNNTSAGGFNTTISVCPAGWGLPTGGTAASTNFKSLNNAINGGSTTTDQGLRNNFLIVYSGSYFDNPINQGTNGYYWSSTANGAEYAYNLNTSSGSVAPGTNPSYKHNSRAVRCVLDTTPIQKINSNNCPATRTKVRDARDNATYWIQKLPDGKCWMLTNLAYGGGGTNTYNDVKTITNANISSYTGPYYMIPSGSNRTVEPTDPSASTSGIGQYGYLYNWCAAMGIQTTTSACMDALTPLPDQNVSICPSGWRLPIGGTAGEYQALNNTINSGSGSNDFGLRSIWLGAYSGIWSSGFHSQDNLGDYYSSTQYSSNSARAYGLDYSSNNVASDINLSKTTGRAVRCIAL